MTNFNIKSRNIVRKLRKNAAKLPRWINKTAFSVKHYVIFGAIFIGLIVANFEYPKNVIWISEYLKRQPAYYLLDSIKNLGVLAGIVIVYLVWRSAKKDIERRSADEIAQAWGHLAEAAPQGGMSNIGVAHALNSLSYNTQDLEHIHLQSTIIVGIDFNNSNRMLTSLDRSIFNNCEIINSNFSNSTFAGSYFLGCRISGSLFRQCDLRGVLFDRCFIATADFARSEVDGARFNDCVFVDSSFKSCVYDSDNIPSFKGCYAEKEVVFPTGIFRDSIDVSDVEDHSDYEEIYMWVERIRKI